jgi:two-component system response regulator DesR
VLAADDNELVAGALERWLSRTPGVRWLGCMTEGEKVAANVAAHKPDVLLLDLDIPGTDTFALIEQCGRESPATRVVILSGRAEPKEIARAVMAGAVGYVVKDERVPDIADYARRAAAGERVFSPAARAALLHGDLEGLAAD